MEWYVCKFYTCHNTSLSLLSINKITLVVATLERERDSPNWRLRLEMGPANHITDDGIAVAVELVQVFLAATF